MSKFISSVHCRIILFVFMLCSISTNLKADVLIDDFTGELGLLATLLPPVVNPDIGVLATSSALGGYRSCSAFVTDGIEVISRTTAGRYTHSQADLTQGTTTVTWDGDNNPSTLNPVGLGGISLQPGVNKGFRITILSFDYAFSQPVDLIFTVYDASDATGNKFSRGTVTLNQAYLNKVVVLPFVELTTSGPSGAADLNNVGAISMLVDGRKGYSLDLSLDKIESGCISLDVNGNPVCPTPSPTVSPTINTGTPVCDTAFAKGGYVWVKDKKSNPENLPSLSLTQNRWGWAIRLSAPGTSSYDIWAGAALNKTGNGVKVGTLTVNWDGVNVEVRYDLSVSGYLIKETHIYASDSAPTGIEPGRYGNTMEFNPGVTSYKRSATLVDAAGDGVWLIGHAVVCR